MQTDMTGKVALVTGGAGGIGEFICERLARAGSTVLMLDVDGSKAEETLGRLGERLGNTVQRIEFVLGDLNDLQATDQLAQDLVKRYDTIDVLVNNACINPLGPLDEADIEEFERTQRINSHSGFVLARAIVPSMKKTGAGWIVNIASITVNGGWGDFVPYVHSKGAIVGMTRSMARELGPFNIRVNSISPGAIPTELERQVWAHKLEEYTQFILDHQSLKRRIEPQEIAQTVHYLCCEASSGMTGQNLSVDGGWWMH